MIARSFGRRLSHGPCLVHRSSPPASGVVTGLSPLRALLLAATLLVSACEAVPRPSASAATAVAGLSTTQLAARLPDEAAGFVRGDTVAAPFGEDGQEAGYRTPGRTGAGATVVLYRQPGATVPPGAESPAVTQAFEALLQDAMRPLPHRRVREQDRFSLPDAGPATLRCVETTGVYGREQVQGLLCVGGVGGGVLRVRVTMPHGDPPPADARAFAAALLDALNTP
jgi:hypothetical protein